MELTARFLDSLSLEQYLANLLPRHRPLLFGSTRSISSVELLRHDPVPELLLAQLNPALPHSKSCSSENATKEPSAISHFVREVVAGKSGNVCEKEEKRTEVRSEGREVREDEELR
jgi:hypothetical protein